MKSLQGLAVKALHIKEMVKVTFTELLKDKK